MSHRREPSHRLMLLSAAAALAVGTLRPLAFLGFMPPRQAHVRPPVRAVEPTPTTARTLVTCLAGTPPAFDTSPDHASHGQADAACYRRYDAAGGAFSFEYPATWKQQSPRAGDAVAVGGIGGTCGTESGYLSVEILDNPRRLSLTEFVSAYDSAVRYPNFSANHFTAWDCDSAAPTHRAIDRHAPGAAPNQLVLISHGDRVFLLSCEGCTDATVDRIAQSFTVAP